MRENQIHGGLRVLPGLKRIDVTKDLFFSQQRGSQGSLFATFKPGLLIFVYFQEVTETEFRKTLQIAQPGAVIELRSTPRFDLGRLDRKEVFEYFATAHSEYFDLTATVQNSSDPDELLSRVKSTFANKAIDFQKPVLFLLAGPGVPDDLSTDIVDTVSAVKNLKPEVVRVPCYTPND